MRGLHRGDFPEYVLIGRWLDILMQLGWPLEPFENISI